MESLIDSSLIVDYLDHLVAPERRLLPEAVDARLRALVPVGFALAAAEKTVQVIYEQALRPADKQHAPWLERVLGQLEAAYGELEPLVAAANGWLGGARLLQSDVTVAVAWRFTQFMTAEYAPLARIDPARYPALAAHSARAEQLPPSSKRRSIERGGASRRYASERGELRGSACAAPLRAVRCGAVRCGRPARPDRAVRRRPCDSPTHVDPTHGAATRRVRATPTQPPPAPDDAVSRTAKGVAMLPTKP
jgi:glutathione S-transferase